MHKKRNQKGFTHHVLLIGVAVVVVSAVGFAGWRIYKNNNKDNASAYNWVTMHYNNPPGYAVMECKASSSTFRLYLKNPTSYGRTLKTASGSRYAGPRSNSSTILVTSGSGTVEGGNTITGFGYGGTATATPYGTIPKC